MSVIAGNAPAAVAAEEDPGVVVASYAFDAGARAAGLVDGSGNGHTLTALSGHGGAVVAIRRGDGHALRFPAKCAERTGCPRTVLRSESTERLNPGTRSFSFGASVLLAPSQTTDGQNVMQKGFSTLTSQWKLQVDGRAGHPSCVLVGDAGGGIKLLRAGRSVADGHWHAVECRRRGPLLMILVDGLPEGSRTVPLGLSVVNDVPMTLGGKGTSANNDQFQGILDDVWVRIS